MDCALAEQEQEKFVLWTAYKNEQHE